MLDPACCCTPVCYKACFWVTAQKLGTDVTDEPPSSPPLTVKFTLGTARIVYHGHALDTFSPIPGFYYHSHMWMMEWCWSSTHNTNSGRNATDYINALLDWVRNILTPLWKGDDAVGSIDAGQFPCNDEAEIQRIKDLYLVTPTPTFIVEDIIDLPRDGCPECESSDPAAVP